MKRSNQDKGGEDFFKEIVAPVIIVIIVVYILFKVFIF